MKGTLEITRAGVNDGVISHATTTDYEHGSWFHCIQDILDAIQEAKEDPGFISATWITLDGDPVDPMSLALTGLNKTKKGHAAIWEFGGGASNTGDSQIITGPAGETLTPIYIRGRGHLSCNSHALFGAQPGQWIIRANHHRKDFNISVYQITEMFNQPMVCSSCAGDGTDHGDGRYDRPCNPDLPCPSCKGTGQTDPALMALLCKQAEFNQGEWDEEPPDFLEVAIQAAKEKATCYHCREPHLIQKEV